MSGRGRPTIEPLPPGAPVSDDALGSRDSSASCELRELRELCELRELWELRELREGRGASSSSESSLRGSSE
jgi:hypothetical protein